MKEIEERPLICYRPFEDAPEGDWKITLTTSLINPVIAWYHYVLGHPGTRDKTIVRYDSSKVSYPWTQVSLYSIALQRMRIE